ncbi:MAG: VOC family protein [Candidatus Lambdaproteobacteria bacterium]|nr:VOC family protein [Candidatus Lambdaproteobacteria bacterium]
MKIERLDHLVIDVRDLDRTCDFYVQVLGMERVTFGAGRTALRFGAHKFNLHEVDGPHKLVADRPIPGSADLCLLTRTPMDEVLRHLAACGVTPIEPPSPRAGALGEILSVYIRDPEGNLIEISNAVGEGYRQAPV